MIKLINAVLWGVALVVLLGGGLYFSVKLKFPQLKFFSLFKGLKSTENGISPFKSLTVSLAARIGVGSLAGVALAIYIGGPGSVFWMWIACIITSINAYCETYLGAKYQLPDGDNYKGGPAFYIKSGLHDNGLAFSYALLVILAYLVGFMSIQANTIAVSINQLYGFSIVSIAVVLTIISFISIMRGIDRIVSITSKLVPIMGIVYILLSIIVIVLNYEVIPQVFISIIKGAFNIKSFVSSFIPTFIIGIQRGTFATEAGLGTGAIASSCTKTTDKVGLGLLQILGIYFTVFIVCTSTALIILTSNYTSLNFDNMNGIELTSYALNYHLGNAGSFVLVLLVIMLAYSTIVAGYYYGECNLKYLIKNIKNCHIYILKCVVTVLLFVGSIVKSHIIWGTVDILVAILAVINMYSLFRLRKEIVHDYYKFKKRE